MVQDIVKSNNCVGCGACSEVCKHNAISMEYNNEGFIQPFVNDTLCIKCNLCRKVCPSLNALSLKYTRGKIYAAANKNNSIRLVSSSGGIFSLIAEYVLNQNGVVFGASFNDKLILAHKGITDIKELNALRGSKYLQSNIRPVYKHIKQLLLDDKIVYFVGTPCQVAALKLFIGKKLNTTGHLITSDLVCHGVTSQSLFNTFTSYLEEKNDAQVLHYNFRDKSVMGWSCCSSSAIIKINKTGKIKKLEYNKILNAYFKAYISGDFYRESCYKCQFTTEERTSDITLADFWGVNKYHKSFYTDYGVSLIIVNSPNGEHIINALEKSLTIIPTQFKYAEQINKCLYQPTPRPHNRNHIFNELQENPYKVIKTYMISGIDVNYLKFLLKKILRKNKRIYKLLFNFKSKIFQSFQ